MLRYCAVLCCVTGRLCGHAALVCCVVLCNRKAVWTCCVIALCCVV